MKSAHIYASYVPDGTEGISRNVERLTAALRDRHPGTRLLVPRLRLDELNQRSLLARQGWWAHRRILDAFDAGDADLVHYHVGIPLLGLFARLSRLRRRRARRPLLVHAWNAYYRRRDGAVAPSRRDRFHHRLFNGPGAAAFGLRGADGVVVASRFQEDQLRRAGHRGPVHVVPSGVDVSDFRPSTADERARARAVLGVPDGPLVLYYGHLSHWKGVDHFVDALPRIFRTHPGARALIAHTTYGGRSEELRQRLRDRHVADRVHLVGASHAPSLLHAADVTVVPTIAAVGTACHPNVILESLASGVPVVASRVGSIPEVVEDGRTGFLVPPGDPARIAEATATALHDRDLHDALARSARADAVARFDWRRIAVQMDQVYQALTDGASTAHPEPAPYEERQGAPALP